MPLRRVARFLADSGYDPKVGAEFTVNYLSRRVSLSRRMGDEETKDAYAFASICAVPHRQTDDTDSGSVLKWLQPRSLIECDPPGSWLPLSSKRFVSTGVVLVDDDISTDTWAKPWSAYLLARRDGYFEYGGELATSIASRLTTTSAKTSSTRSGQWSLGSRDSPLW